MHGSDRIIPGVPMCAKPEYATVVANDEHGYGVHSWHMDAKDADHNAKLLGGRVCPVDYYNGKLLIPHYAKAVAKKEFDTD